MTQRSRTTGLAVRLNPELAKMQKQLMSDAVAGRCSYAEALKLWKTALAMNPDDWGVTARD